MQAGETEEEGGELGCILFRQRTKQRFKVLSYPRVLLVIFATVIELILINIFKRIGT